MEKKIIFFGAFGIIVVSLCIVLIARTFTKSNDKNKVSTVIIPQVKQHDSDSDDEFVVLNDDLSRVSFIQLLSDETLIDVANFNIDDDSYVDQAIIVKKSSSPFISIVIGLYDKEKSEYPRSAVIETPCTQVKNFSFTQMDLSGNHKNALIFQGYKDNDDYILQAFHVSVVKGKPVVNKIVDLVSDGSIEIENIEQNEAYDSSNAKGKSVPIVVYCSDTNSKNSNDQLRIRYDWDDSANKYVEKTKVRVPGYALEASERNKILNGDAETFDTFLDGIWYKTNEKTNEQRYIFFNHENDEIVFYNENGVEIFIWSKSAPRSWGSVITSKSEEIISLQRLISVSFRSTDQIHIRVTDDVRLADINDINFWNGDYKKMNKSYNFGTLNSNQNSKQDFLKEFEKVGLWKNTEGNYIKFEKGNFSIIQDKVVETGVYTDLQIKDNYFIQFRSFSENPTMNGAYLVTSSVVKDSYVLQLYAVQPDNVYSLEKKPIIISKAN